MLYSTQVEREQSTAKIREAGLPVERFYLEFNIVRSVKWPSQIGHASPESPITRIDDPDSQNAIGDGMGNNGKPELARLLV